MAKFLSVILISLISILSSQSFARGLGEIPMQDAGRIKPYDSFAREQLKLIYGKYEYEGRPAPEIVLTWVLQPEAWESKAIFEIRYHLLKRALKLSEEQNLFTMKEIFASDRLSVVMQELNSQRETKAPMDPYFQSVQRLETQLGTFREIAAGRMLRWVPPAAGDAWLGIPDFPEASQAAFKDLTQAFLKQIMASTGQGSVSEAESELKIAVEKFCEVASQMNPSLYNVDRKVSVEIFYNHFHPFRVAAYLYILCGISLLGLWMFGLKSLIKASWIFALSGMALHILGFALRIYLTERAPVTNMYETVIWVALGSLIFSMIIEYIYKWRFILGVGASVAAFCCLLGDVAPAVLDSSLQPLEPVLRSNFWLTVHVMTITISYGAFFLAFALGDFGLILYCRKSLNKALIGSVTLSIYRAIQIGVAFLAPGIILGGVWANYSWGRFWGWDPKETWALIALLGYLAVLHGRLAGLLKSFGIIAAAVVAFSLVIMAWYGVNFVLGAGLHTYGFGAGGVEYVAAFVGIHLIFVTYVAVARRSQTN